MKNKRMKIARMEVDMKQSDLAETVGVTRQTIGLIESGEYNPTLNVPRHVDNLKKQCAPLSAD